MKKYNNKYNKMKIKEGIAMIDNNNLYKYIYCINANAFDVILFINNENPLIIL